MNFFYIIRQMANDLTIKSEAVHRDNELTILTMVLNRMPFIADNPENRLLISNFILEVMIVLEKCLQIGKDDETKIGVESNYTILMQSMIADLVTLQILLVSAMEATAGNAATETEALNTFLKRAKAGSVEVEFGPFSLKDNATLAMSGEQFFKYYKKSAINKAAQIGCSIDICDDCSIKYIEDSYIAKPFIVMSNCPDSKEYIPERDL